MLHKGETANQTNLDLKSMSMVDLSDLNIVDGILYSSTEWSGATNNGVEMPNIGFTGIDNGLISFRKDRITNDRFVEILTRSVYEIKEGDKRLFLTPITGNTLMYEYPMYLVESDEEKYIACKGGFYQGFFKAYNYEYQVLPDALESDWTLHFTLRPRTDYEVTSKNINSTHQENEGIFFFMGTRAENKFWPLYKVNDELIDEFKKETPIDNSIYSAFTKELSNKVFYDSEGRTIDSYGHKEITTDNKFLLFDRTSDGFTIDTWVEGTEVTLTEKRNYPTDNYFLLMDRTSTGYTIDTISEYNAQREYDYDILKDVQDNAFALRITKDGSIGYRYAVLNCKAENHFEVVEEYSKKGIVKNDDWNTINVRISKMNDNEMKLYFYVNGFLVFISKTLKPFAFKHINDVPEKQETVPYNISIGGGSLGLMETILTDYYAISNYVLPIEKHFCGSFMGDIQTFKMYGGYVGYSSVINYLS
jgi:hypothetical protein